MRKTDHFVQLKITKWFMNTIVTKYDIKLVSAIYQTKDWGYVFGFRLGGLRRIPSNWIFVVVKEGVP